MRGLPIKMCIHNPGLLLLLSISYTYSTGVPGFLNYSRLAVDGTFSFESSFSFKFRTCLSGTLIEQGTGDLLIVLYPTNLTQHSVIQFQWKYNFTNSSYSLLLAPKFSLDGNTLNEVKFTRQRNSSIFSVTNGVLANQVVIDNSFLVNSSAGSPLVFGSSSFSGCVFATSNLWTNVSIPCPLSFGAPCPSLVCPAGYTGRNCETDINECELKSQPCHPYSLCVDLVNDFKCVCGPQWTGKDCTIFLGSLCDSNPCQNTGACRLSEDKNNFTCQCSNEFTGRFCEQRVYPCLRNPCLHGFCFNWSLAEGAYNCSCFPGHTGVHCETNVNDCFAKPCGSGVCIDGINSYTCNCTGSGFTGPNCKENIDECAVSKPCRNNASCFDEWGSYMCNCVSGFTGKDCQVNVDDCVGNPCNNGTCVDQVNGYECKCFAGFTGAYCETNMNDCLPNPCSSNGTCIDGIASYKCLCEAGFTGIRCEADVQECLSNPCLNNGTCVELLGTFKCNCLPGFTGDRCQINIDDCAPKPCVNGLCIDQVNNFTCICSAGYEGRNCEVNRDDCSPNPCLHFGTCTDGIGEFQCSCIPSYNGSRCETWQDPCFPVNPCQNGGACLNHTVKGYQCQCSDLFGGPQCQYRISLCYPNDPCVHGNCSASADAYNCTCQPGWQGVNCSLDIDECMSPLLCRNGATCLNSAGSFSCGCKKGYTGRYCETEINECETTVKPCNDRGVCVDRVGSFICACDVGYYGSRCEFKVDECKQKGDGFCKNGGTCVNLEGVDVACKCMPGFGGSVCERNIDECAFGYCLNSTGCVDLVNDYNCTCIPGIKGKNCSEDINECDSSPCKNKATCANLLNAYACTCSVGYNGTDCENDIDWCSWVPCRNGAACTDGLETFSCSCFSGFTGKSCEVDINECAPVPCQYGGLCVEKSNRTAMEANGFPYNSSNYLNKDGYLCVCRPGATGVNCETNIDDCTPDPCMNNGTCNDMFNGYTCSCALGFTGKNCSVDIDECASVPCLNNATCTDMIGQYLCNCPANFTGKNCEHRINMCDYLDPCLNGATCEEQEISFDYRCVCLPGFIGRLCETSTTVNFVGNGSWIVNRSFSSSLNIQFITTIPNGLVCQILLEGGGSLAFHLISSFLHMTAPDGSIGRLSLTPLTDGTWHTVTVLLNASSSLGVVIDNFRCEENCPSNVLKRISPIRPISSIRIGGSASLPGTESFIGCVQSVLMDNVNLLPTINGVLTGGTPGPCRRKPACAGSPCNNRGVCNDLWSYNTCACYRQFFGESCLDEVKSFSFQKNATSAFMSASAYAAAPAFAAPAPAFAEATVSTRLSGNATFEFLLRTRAPDGLIALLLEGVPTSPSVPYEFIVVFVEQGKLHIKQAGFSELTVSTPINDGALHEVSVGRSAVLLDKKFAGVAVNKDLLVGRVFLGGVRDKTLYRTSIGSMLDFDGCIQAVTLAGVYLTNQPLPGLTTHPVVSSGVVEGCVGGDVCSSQPCEFNGTCNDLWNAYNCSCKAGFYGERCTLYGCKHFGTANTCPVGTKCVDIPERPSEVACAAPVTFDGINSTTAIFNMSGRHVAVNQVSFALRTRQSHASIFAVARDSSYFAVGLENGGVSARYNYGSGDKAFKHQMFVGDGAWHDVIVNSSAFETTITVDGSRQSITDIILDAKWRDLLGDNTAIFGVALSQVRLYFRSAFLGCLDRTFVGSYLANLTGPGVRDGCMSSNPCLPASPCERGTCADVFNDFQCICPQFYAGKPCNLTANLTCAFSPAPCLNGTCFTLSELEKRPRSLSKVGFDYFRCDCQAGFLGYLCDVPTDECEPKPCVNGGTCQDKHLDYDCACVAGWTGKNCSVNIDDCAGSPCDNNGTCIDGLNSFVCNCTRFFKGPNCKTDVDECVELAPCQNGGNCTNLVGDYSCRCREGFFDKDCQYNNTMLCEVRRPCLHGACNDSMAGYSCSCLEGWQGTNCDVDVDECAPKPCVNNGTCTDSRSYPLLPHVAGYNCSCLPMHTGINCERERDPCEESPCANGGNCTKIDYQTFSCACLADYRGVRCETLRTPCTEGVPCEHNGTCVSSSRESFICRCLDGFTGSNCSIDTDPCRGGFGLCNSTGSDGCKTDSLVCSNSSLSLPECHKVYASYTCICKPGFKGRLCDFRSGQVSGSESENFGLLVGVPVAAVVLLLIILIFCLVRRCRAQSGLEGTYSPNKEEQIAGHVEMSAMKKPNTERLI